MPNVASMELGTPLSKIRDSDVLMWVEDRRNQPGEDPNLGIRKAFVERYPELEDMDGESIGAKYKYQDGGRQGVANGEGKVGH
ncbi:hypothetical protein NQ314_001122 [Rhamnusium bicolor]|uniref:Uncharacterized protein n=1 Tax=Rhamnusium bicolor TaxID=1586634 RepID=A0AAV8ZU98_9CUCU|nr:hypothetical protein NQ314_001122 [Rhamnusium bicolor]